ncbi:MAG: 50S ribosomal protein L19 [Parcubacteria group bacterium]|jgi:large subunit ribosomal protein L19
MRSEVIAFNKTQRKDTIDFYAGDVVKVYRRIKEGEKERVQIFEGMIIAIKGRQSSSPTVTVRKVSNGVGVEIVVPMFSPFIDKIELIKRAKVRKAKLYYVRDKVAKALRFKYTDAKDIVKKEVENPVAKEEVVEEVVEAEKAEVAEEVTN